MIFDGHSDLLYDVTRRRLAGEERILETHHLDRLRSGGVEGLHILDGQILRIPDKEGLKIPHIGWNSLHLQNGGRLFAGVEEGAFVYFVHSYYLKAADKGIVKASTEYGTEIHASVEQGNVFACQFHPEKSSGVGLQILKNFAG